MYEKRFMALLTVLMMLSGLSLLAQKATLAQESSMAQEGANFNVYFESDHLIIEPNGEYESYTVGMQGPICRSNVPYDGGKTAVIDLFDKKGKPFEDGVWNVEITARPYWSAEEWEVINKARDQGDYKTLAVTLPPKGSLDQTFSFSMLEGRAVDPSEVEKNGFKGKAGLADFLINDDLIVDGSACIGFDCVNGEAFGFDTLRLKENNLRIKFDDTSVAASFPRNDWQLTANDSANGGAPKFSIDDITGGRTPFTVEANAPSHSLYVDDGGRLGLGTSTPSVEIHAKSGDTPTLRLQQDGSSGFAPQTWDVAGNETNFFVRDVTNGSALPFRIRPGAPTSSIHIDADGNVGLDTSSPSAKLHVEDGDALIKKNGGASLTIEELDSAASTQLTLDSQGHAQMDMIGGASTFSLQVNSINNLFQINDNIANSEFEIRVGGYIRLGANGADSLEIASNGAMNIGLLADATTPAMTIDGATGAISVDTLTVTTAFTQPSDVNLKDEFQTVDPVDVLNKIVDMPITTWEYKHDKGNRHMGVMAQDFYAAFGLGRSDKLITTIDPDGVTMAAIQGLNQKFDEKVAQKDNEIISLKEKNQQLEARLATLEALVNSLAKKP